MTLICYVQQMPFAQRVIIIDPAGDVKRTGRRIGDNFERGLTLQCAEKIKELLEERAPHIKVIITRMPGDIVYDLQNACLANRIHADLFINLNFYATQDTKPTIFLYQFSYGADFAHTSSGLSLHTYDQAYRINKHITDVMSGIFKTVLSEQKYQQLFSCSGVYSAPIKPLIGIISPSIALDAGLKHKDMWRQYVEPLVQACISAMEQMG